MARRQIVEVPTGKIEPIVKLTAIAFQIKPCQSVLWVGGVGIGKSSLAERLAKTLNRKFVPLYALRLEPTDVLGLPLRDIDPELQTPVVKYALPEELLIAIKSPTIVVWDELDKANEDTRRAILEILNWNKIGRLHYHSQSANLAIINPVGVGGRYTLTEDVVNRLLVLEFPLDVEGVAKGLLDGTIDPLIQQDELLPLPTELCPPVDLDAYPQHARRWQFVVGNFLKTNETAAWGFYADWESPEPFATPRSWTKLCRILGGIDSTPLSEPEKVQLRRLAVKGMVGDGAGEFLTWLALKDLPEPETVLADPTKLPKRLDALALTLSNIASFVQRNPEKAWLPAWQVAAYIDQKLALEDMAVNFALLLKSIGHKLQLDFNPVRTILKNTNIPTVWLLKGGN